jgi:dTDP-4-amino-4,6-dideoxygalactose transaminase
MSRRDYLPFGKPNFSDEEIGAVARVLRSGWVGMGPETIAFEHELADSVGAPHAVTTLARPYEGGRRRDAHACVAIAA